MKLYASNTTSYALFLKEYFPALNNTEQHYVTLLNETNDEVAQLPLKQMQHRLKLMKSQYAAYQNLWSKLNETKRTQALLENLRLAITTDPTHELKNFIDQVQESIQGDLLTHLKWLHFNDKIEKWIYYIEVMMLILACPGTLAAIILIISMLHSLPLAMTMVSMPILLGIGFTWLSSLICTTQSNIDHIINCIDLCAKVEEVDITTQDNSLSDADLEKLENNLQANFAFSTQAERSTPFEIEFRHRS